MGSEDNGQSTGSVDGARVGMDLEEITASVVGESVKNQGELYSRRRHQDQQVVQVQVQIQRQR
jgi:hypothetical protein